MGARETFWEHTIGAGFMAAASQDELRQWVQDICEHREYAECWHGDLSSDGYRGDCGWWDYCEAMDCSLHHLREFVGLERRPDGASRAPR
jgi:hypothetical protein